ncbi:MAG: ATP-binding protein, partial [Cyclobacteriaceae bacterium]|nr:ATP-binding protein [Cyclobacteriaceae bacterium]
VDIESFDKGTILEISSLRSKWDREKLLGLKRHLQRLINPAHIGDKQEFQIYLKVEEEIDEDRKREGDFDRVNGIVRNIVFEKLGIKTTIINCTIDEDGKKIQTELIDKGTFVYRLEEENEYPLLKNINIVLFYLNPEAKRAFTRIMGIQPVRYGSVFFYKNGIKINPWGNEGDDWLGLDRRKTQGTRRFLGNRDVMGRIEVTGSQPDFNEVTSRDGGVIKTPALVQLIKSKKGFFYKKALIRLEKYVIEGIAWDSEKKTKDPGEIKADSFKIITKLAGTTKDKNLQIEFNENLLDIYSKRQIEKTPEIIKNIKHVKNLIKSKEARAYIDFQTKAVRSAFRNLRKTQRELERELRLREKQALFLESTTSEDRKDILAIQHQMGIGAETIRRHLLRLKGKIEKGVTITRSDLISVIDDIILQVQLMSSFARAPFLTKAKFNLLSDEIKGDLALFIKQYVERVYLPFNETILNGKKVTVKVEHKPDVVFERDFSPTEFTVVIDNLISNSINANANQINIGISVVDENILEIKVKDDGDGIKDKDLDKIFDFGFSTRGGSGIGLYHVRKILKKYGNISVNNRLDKGVEFIIEVKK